MVVVDAVTSIGHNQPHRGTAGDVPGQVQRTLRAGTDTAVGDLRTVAPDLEHRRTGGLLIVDADVGDDRGARAVTVGEDLVVHHPTAAGGHDRALPAQRVLVDGDHVGVAQHVERVRRRADDVGTDQHRRGHDRPQAEVGAVLVVGEAAVAHLQHVRVVPVPRSGEARQVVVEVGGVVHAGPVGADVTGGTPHVADVGAPFPHLRRAGAAPLDDAVQDRPAGVAQRGAHGLVPRLRVHALVVAVVVLQVVHAPRGEQVGVLLLVPQTAGEAQCVAGLG